MPASARQATIVGAVAVVLGTALIAADTPYRLVDHWGPLPDGSAWGEVTGVVVDRRDRVIALRRSDPPIVELDPSVQVLKMWGETMFVWPHGFRIDRDGFLWITDARAAEGRGQQVLKIAPHGGVVMTLGTSGKTGVGPNFQRSR